MKTTLDYVRLELGTDRYKTWAAAHPTDDRKVHFELGGTERPDARDSYANIIITAIRAGLAAEQPPAPLSLRELGRNVMFTAQDPAVCLGRLPAHWRVALTADPGPDGKWDQAVRAAAPQLRQAGHMIAVWGVQTQVGAARIKQFAADLKADFVIFQAETVEEFNSAIEAGATMVVGNPNSWTDTQRQYAIARGDTFATLFEVYANAGSPWPDTASSRGVPVTTEVLGVGSWENRPDVQLDQYLLHTPPGVWATMSIYLAENLSDESWGLLP